MRRIWRQCAGCCEKDGTEMKRFQFGLDTVLQYKRQVLDGAQNEYAEVIQRVRQQERRLREAEARHRSLNQQFRRAEAEGITIADAMGYEMGLRMLEGEIQREESRLHQLQTEAEERRKRMIAARQDTSSLEKLREKKLESYEKELQRQEELRIDELVANTRAGRPEQKMDFQALLNEKRTQADRERTEQEPQKTDPSQDTETGKTEQKDEDVAAQAAGQGVPLMLDLSAVLAGGGIVPFVGCVVVTEQAEQITAQAPALPAADAVVEGEKAAEPALPQNIERFGEAAVPQKAEQEAAPGSLISSAGQVEGEGQGAELQVKAEGQHMEQPEGQSEQSGKQPGTDQKMDVEVTQLQTGGDQKLFQGTEAAPVKVGDGAVLDTTSEQFDARLSRTIRSIADQGIQKIELKLTPEHLGNVVVELTRSEGSALHVVLRAESEHTANLLREHLGTLGSMLQNGSQQEVRIEVAHPQESGRSWQQTDQNGGGQNGQPQEQHRDPKREESENFLHQLKLGLLEQETAPV